MSHKKDARLIWVKQAWTATLVGLHVDPNFLISLHQHSITCFVCVSSKDSDEIIVH